MVRIQSTFADGPTPEQRAYAERQARRREIADRARCDIMRFWRVCVQRRCRRNHACSGDAQACFQRLWPLVPEADKEWVRGAVIAASGGATGDAIARAADARRADYLQPAAAASAPATERASPPIQSD